MSKINDYNCRICVKFNWEIYKIFTIWYYKDWWYFIWDLFNNSAYKYLASKVYLNNNNLTSITNIDNDNTYNIELVTPKISHHIDWNCHISGYWVKSWYDSEWKPKWLYNLSWNLNFPNNWGPIFSFNIWSNMLKFFNKITLNEKTSKKYHLIFPLKDFLNNLIIEWFYIHKTQLPDNMNDSVFFIKNIQGRDSLIIKPIKSPETSPYVIWLSIRDNLKNINTDIFSYNWGPSIIDEKWWFSNLTLLLTKSNIEKYKTLNYKNY